MVYQLYKKGVNFKNKFCNVKHGKIYYKEE